MRTINNMTFRKALYFFFVLMFWEYLLAISTTGITSIGLILIFLFTLSLSCLVFIIEILTKPKFSKIFTFVLLLTGAILFCAQRVYYNIFGTFFTLYSLGYGGQVFEFEGIILTEIIKALGWIILFLIPVALYWPIASVLPQIKRIRKVYAIMVIWLSVAAFTIAVVTINLSDRLPGAPYHAYYVDLQPNYAVSNFGLVTMGRLEIQNYLLDLLPQSSQEGPLLLPSDIELITEKTEEKIESTTSTQPGLTDPVATEDQSTDISFPEHRPSPVILDIDFNELAQNETNNQLRQLHQWVDKRTPSMSNEYTGLLADYNLIFITAESYSHYAVDPDLTPTLHYLQHQGLNFTDFYNPLWGVSTSDGEYVAVTGLLPKSGVWSMYRSAQNSMPFTMGNQLRTLGYSTYAYHNHNYDYYNRDASHPNLGYIYKGLGNGLEVTPTWPASDVEMMEMSVNDYIDQEPFHAYYMTVSGHLQYNFFGNYIASKNKEHVDHLTFTEPAKAYLATQIELDRALEYLLSKLEETGTIDRTLIVISSDHYPYGLEQEDIESLAGHQVDRNFELHKSSLIIYAAGIEPQVITDPVSSLDIIPTISNLLGLKYDSRLLMGRDIFSDTDPLVIFLNRSFITSDGRYNAPERTWHSESDNKLDQSQIVEILNDIEERFYYSQLILDNDYYGKIGLTSD